MTAAARPLKIFAAVVVAALGVALLGKTLEAIGTQRTVTLPAPTGPHAVGRRTFSWRDSTRADLLAPDPSSPRELLVWVWYPARVTPGAKVAEYLPKAWVDSVRQRPRGHRLDRVRAHALDGAPVTDARATYPLLIFSPGLGRLPTDYTALIEDIASHGYIVMAVAHPYSTPDVVFPDGRVVHEAQSRLPFRYDRTVTVLAADLVSVLEYATRHRAGGDSLFARADLSRVATFGHSFGGASAAQACGMDARFLAGVDLDGSIFGPVRTAGVRQPFLLMMADLGWMQRFRRKPKPTIIDRRQARIREEGFVAQSPRASWLNVKHLTHMSFADEAYFFSAPYWLLELVGARMDGRETQGLASRYVRAFFGRHLANQESPGRELDQPDGGDLSWVRRAPY